MITHVEHDIVNGEWSSYKPTIQPTITVDPLLLLNSAPTEAATQPQPNSSWAKMVLYLVVSSFYPYMQNLNITRIRFEEDKFYTNNA